MSRGYIWRKICGITIAAVLFLACGVSEAAKEQTIQVGLAKDKSQYTITANAPFLVTDAAGKKVFLKLRSGEKAMIKADREGLYVNGKKLSVQKISVALDGKAKKGFLNMDGNLYRGSLAISCVKSNQQAKPKAAVKGTASQNKKTASVSLTILKKPSLIRKKLRIDRAIRIRTIVTIRKSLPSSRTIKTRQLQMLIKRVQQTPKKKSGQNCSLSIM